MSIVFVKFPINKEKKQNLNTLFWYDQKNQKMRKFEASRLEFKYSFDKEIGENRLLPNPIVDERTEPVNPSKIIENWHRDYTNYNDSGSVMNHYAKSNNGIQFEVPEKEVDEFIYDLEINKLEGVLL